MHLAPIFMVDFLKLFLLFIDEGFFLFVDIVSVFKKESNIFNSKIFAIINLDIRIPLSHSPLLLLLLLIQFCIRHHLRSKLLLLELFLLLKLSLLYLLQVLLILSLLQITPGYRLTKSYNWL